MLHDGDAFWIIHVDDSQDFDDLTNVLEEKVEYWMVTITNENSDVEVDINQCKADLAKIERELFDLLVKQDTTIPPLHDFIEQWIQRCMETIERVD